MKAVITVGVSASGKSHWAREQKDFRVIERDVFRRHILTNTVPDLGMENMWKHWKFPNKAGEAAVTVLVNETIEDCATVGGDLICADTNLNPKYRDALVAKLEGLGYEVELKYFPVDFMVAVKRDERRRDSVGRDVIYKQLTEYKKYNVHGIGNKYVADTSKPSAVIFDIDGTLAAMVDRGPFDWAKVGTDKVNQPVADFLRYASQEHAIIIMSGRDSVCRAETLNWLNKNKIFYSVLFMRKENDMRKDAEIKEELFFEHVAPFYNVKWVCDDRPQIVRKWQELGLWTFNVGVIDHEF